jgi:hypothetical protein
LVGVKFYFGFGLGVKFYPQATQHHALSTTLTNYLLLSGLLLLYLPIYSDHTLARSECDHIKGVGEETPVFFVRDHEGKNERGKGDTQGIKHTYGRIKGEGDQAN